MFSRGLVVDDGEEGAGRESGGVVRGEKGQVMKVGDLKGRVGDVCACMRCPLVMLNNSFSI